MSVTELSPEDRKELDEIFKEGKNEILMVDLQK